MWSITNGHHGVVQALALTLALVSAAGVYADDPLPVYVRFTLTDERLKNIITDEQKAELESATTELVAKACSDYIKHRWRFVAAAGNEDNDLPLLVVSLVDDQELTIQIVRPNGILSPIWSVSLPGQGAQAEALTPVTELPAKIKERFSAALVKFPDDVNGELCRHAPIALGALVQIDQGALTAKIGLDTAELRSSLFDIECEWNLRDVRLGCHGTGFVPQLEVQLQTWEFAGNKDHVKNHQADLAKVNPIRVYLNKFKEAFPIGLTTTVEGQ